MSNILNYAQFQFFDPLRFSSEFIYSIIITLLFLFIFLRTRKIFNISKYDGIKYFRLSFLFFFLAFSSRVLFFILRIFMINNIFSLNGKFITLISLIFITYLSTIGIGYLIYSSVWKKIKHEKFIFLINIIAFLSIFMFLIKNSIFYFLLIQISLIWLLFYTNKKKSIKFIYATLSLFWIINISMFIARRALMFEIKMLFQILSIISLIVIIYKILKWTK